MASLVNPYRLHRFNRRERSWSQDLGYYLAPFLCIHEIEQDQSVDRRNWKWVWTVPGPVRKCMNSALQVGREWQATRTRGPPTPSRQLNTTIERNVQHLARIFNKHQVKDLKGLVSRGWSEYREVVRAIEDSVYQVSKVKPTREVRPVLGSKILHHFFPSMIPVYDNKAISQGALRTKEFTEFEADSGNWMLDAYPEDPFMAEYDHYFGYASFQLDTANKSDLASGRKDLAEAYSDFAPHALYVERSSLLWRLDAKLVELCLIGSVS